MKKKIENQRQLPGVLLHAATQDFLSLPTFNCSLEPNQRQTNGLPFLPSFPNPRFRPLPQSTTPLPLPPQSTAPLSNHQSLQTPGSRSGGARQITQSAGDPDGAFATWGSGHLGGRRMLHRLWTSNSLFRV